MYEKELDLAKRLALEAGQIIMRIYATDFSHVLKSDKSPVTEADTSADAIIVKGIKHFFPTHGILSEESDDDLSRLDKEFVWIIDPLDGTREFVSKNGEFTVNIGLTREGVPVLGVIYVPATGVMYYSSKNLGAYMDKEGKIVKLYPSKKREIKDFIVVRSRSHGSEKLSMLLATLGIVRVVASGSSIKGCLVAEGSADIYIRDNSICEWDVCAMNAIVNEAGGKMTGFDGHEFSYNKRTPRVSPFVISNGQVHEKIIEEIEKKI